MSFLASYEGSNDDYENNGTAATAGQSFQVLANGKCPSFQFWGSKGNGATGTFKFELKTGSPTGTVIATTGTLNTSVLSAYGTPAWNSLLWTTPVDLVTGTTYYLVYTALSGSSNDESRWSVDTTSSSYASGEAYNGSVARTGTDRSFRIHNFEINHFAANTAENVGGPGTSGSFNSNGLEVVPVTDRGFVEVWVESGNNANPTSLTWGGVALTMKEGSIATPGRGWSSLWYGLAPANGAVTLGWTYASSDSPVISWSLYNGVKQVAPEASAQSTATSATSITTAVTTISDNAFVVGGASNNFGTPTAGANTTARFLNVRSVFDSGAPQTPAGSKSLQLTNGAAGNWGMGVMAIAPYLIPQVTGDAFQMGANF